MILNTEDSRIEERMIELEMKVTYQDGTIEDLNETVTRLQLEVQRIERTVEQLKLKLSPTSLTGADINIANEKPPHY